MRPKEKTYQFKLYDEDLANEQLIQDIRKAIETLPVVYFSYVIVDLFKCGSKQGIPFFQTTRHREFKKTDYYTFEIRVDGGSDKQEWILYEKILQTKEQVLQAFEEICVKRTSPDLSEWKKGYTKWAEPNPKDDNLKILKNPDQNYFSIEAPTIKDYIVYLESLRYCVNFSENYIAEYLISLAYEYCRNGQYKNAKEMYESITFAREATYQLANLIMSGRFGKPDYKLAYEYYEHTCLVDNLNDLGAKIEIAKMHRDGKYFKPDYRVYKRMIKDIEEECIKYDLYSPHLADLFYELAMIEKIDGNTKQAIKYCLKARYALKLILMYGHDEDTIKEMANILKLLYSLTPFNASEADFLDLLYIMDTPFKATFIYENEIYDIDGSFKNGYLIIQFDCKYYRDSVNFLLKAELGGHRILHETDKITIIEVQQ